MMNTIMEIIEHVDTFECKFNLIFFDLITSLEINS